MTRWLWTSSEYCPFHPAIQDKNKERIKFRHDKMIEKGKVVFFKQCPKCFVIFRYPEGVDIKTPQVITNV